MACRVGVFTDTYLPTLNGVSYTIKAFASRWPGEGREMPIAYPGSRAYDPGPNEYPVRSLPFPFYPGFRVGLPRVPDALADVDLVHAHTPFGLGLAGLRVVRSRSCPLVASYHTPTSEYASYLAPISAVERFVSGTAKRYERWYYNKADIVLTPTATTAEYVRETVGVATPVRVVTNGVDTDRFTPGDTDAFRRRYELPEGPLIGYTGRHGHEKNLTELLEAVAANIADWTVVFGGDGPATSTLKQRADELDIDARFLGRLDRDELPPFYASLDVFGFPSPIETQGLAALEAMACGTPVVGVDAGALAETIEPGTTGYHYDPGDIEDFSAKLQQALDEKTALRANCLDRREKFSLDRAVEDLDAVYQSVVAGE